MPDVSVSCADVARLARDFFPVLRFDADEDVFPVSCESWLRHVDSETWGPKGDQSVGTAILRSPGPDQSAVASSTVLGGCAPTRDDPELTPIALTDDPGDSNAIGNPAYADFTPDAWNIFLKVGGWTPDPQAVGGSNVARGNQTYLRAIYSDVFAALNPAIAPAVPETARFPDAPPESPSVTAEVSWGTALAASSRQAAGLHQALRSDPTMPEPEEALSLLDRYLVLTHYLLYPVLDVPPTLRQRFPRSTDFIRSREGQWEAISLFFRADQVIWQGGRPDDPLVPPDTFRFQAAQIVPRFAVYSQGVNILMGRRDEGVGECRPWNQVQLAGGVPAGGVGHPVVYVAAGTHKNFFVPGTVVVLAANPGVQRSAGARAVLRGLDRPVELSGTAAVVLGLLLAAKTGEIVVAAGVVTGILPAMSTAAAAAPLLTTLFLLALLIFLVLLLIALVLLIVILVQSASDVPPTPARDLPPVDESQELAVSGGRGAAVTPAPGVVPSSPLDAAAGAAARTVSAPRLPVINTIRPAAGCEPPPWWVATLRWGIRVGFPGVPVNQRGNLGWWDSGTFRLDPYNASGAYNNLREMVFHAVRTGEGL